MPTRIESNKKLAIVNAYNGGETADALSAKHGVGKSTIQKWARDFKEQAERKHKSKVALGTNHKPEGGPNYLAYLKEENELLKKMYGELSINYEKLRVLYRRIQE